MSRFIFRYRLIQHFKVSVDLPCGLKVRLGQIANLTLRGNLDVPRISTSVGRDFFGGGCGCEVSCQPAADRRALDFARAKARDGVACEGGFARLPVNGVDSPGPLWGA